MRLGFDLFFEGRRRMRWPKSQADVLWKVVLHLGQSWSMAECRHYWLECEAPLPVSCVETDKPLALENPPSPLSSLWIHYGCDESERVLKSV